MAEKSAEARVYYRFVESNPPTRRDFLSNQQKGEPPRGLGLERPDLWSGISVYATPEAVRRRARRYQWRGYLARLEIPPEVPVRIEKTLGRHHYTLWGDADTLLGCVVYPLLEI